MEHPPKQGLKQECSLEDKIAVSSFNGTSTKTRIETFPKRVSSEPSEWVLMEHPPKQGLKRCHLQSSIRIEMCFNGTSTKTRIET